MLTSSPKPTNWAVCSYNENSKDMLVITHSFQQKELQPLAKYYRIDDIQRAIAKIDTSGVRLPNLGYRNGYLVKLRLPHAVAGRLIAYVFIQKNYVIPIVLRLKTDKVIGENLALNNKKAKALIIKNLESAMTDIRNNRYIKY